MITTNVGRIFRNKPRHFKAFTLTELLIVIALASVITATSLGFISKYFYYYKTQIVITKIKSLITLTRTLALITNKPVSLCSYNKELGHCDANWHYPIIIFYYTDKKISPLTEAIFIEHPILSVKETLIFNQFQQNYILTFNQYGDMPHNGSITYSNNHNQTIFNINKQGQIREGS